MRVLIVDDNASMRAVLASLLTSRGYTIVDSLEDGTNIMASIREHAPDIVCLDYEMPGRNGLEILHEINNSVPDIDVVFITASEDPTLAQKAADAGAAGFIHKPFGQKQIIEELDQVYAARQKAAAANQNQVAASAAAPTALKQAPSDAEPAPMTAAAGEPTAAPDAVAEPVAASDAETSAAPLPPPAPPNPLHPTAIVADDNGSIRLLLKGLLTDAGLDVVHLAVNGADAVNAAKLHHPSVVCLDVDMPVMSGMDALPLIRAACPSTAVVIITGNTSRGIVEQAASCGAKGYIVKPLRPAYVEAFMTKLFPRMRRERQK